MYTCRSALCAWMHVCAVRAVVCERVRVSRSVRGQRPPEKRKASRGGVGNRGSVPRSQRVRAHTTTRRPEQRAQGRQGGGQLLGSARPPSSPAAGAQRQQFSRGQYGLDALPHVTAAAPRTPFLSTSRPCKTPSPDGTLGRAAPRSWLWRGRHSTTTPAWLSKTPRLVGCVGFCAIAGQWSPG